MSDKKLLCHHLEQDMPAPCTQNNENDARLMGDFNQCFDQVRNIFDKGYNQESGTEMVTTIQRQRSLLSEIMLKNFITKPNPKMADAINTVLGQMEKSIRDDRKEKLQHQQIRSSKESFDLFSKALAAVASGELAVPTFENTPFFLDPNQSLMDNDEAKIKPGELLVGRHEIDIKPLEQKLAEIDNASMGEEIE